MTNSDARVGRSDALAQLAATNAGLRAEIRTRKQAEARLLESQAQLRLITRSANASRAFLQTVIDTITESMVVVDRNRRIVLANQAARRLAGGGDPAATGLKCHQLSHHRDTPCEGLSDPCPFTRVLETGRAVVATHTHYDAEGREQFAEVTAAPIFNDTGEVIQVVESSRDITERKRHEQELAHMASHDSLTGLPNRRVFEDALARAAARALRGTPSAVLLFDVDRFKAVNDALGHAAGDEVLVRVTRLAQEQLRAGDVLARIGGDEFAALLEGVTAEQGRAIAERARAAVAEFAFVPGRRIQPSLSIGVAAISGHEDARTVVANADTAMYQAKNLGRDRVVVHGQTPTLHGTAVEIGAAAG